MSFKKDFIEEVKEKKKKIMMGIIIDLEYYARFLSANNEDEARDNLETAKKEMANEQNNVVKDKGGRIVADNRDLKVINEIAEKIQTESEKINEIAEIKKEQLTHTRNYKNLQDFYDLVSNVPEEVDKELEEIENL